MRVGILTTSFPLPATPSSGAFVQRLVEGLAPHAEVSVLTPAPNSDTADFRYPGYAMHLFRYAPRRLQILAHQPGGIPVALRNGRWLFLLVPVFLGAMFLACLKRFRKMDVIHANWAACGAIAGLAGWVLGIPVMTTLRGADVTRIQRSVVDRALLGLCLLTNRRVACVSEAIRQSVADSFPSLRDKLLTIPNGVAEALFSIKRNSRESDTGFRFITIGSLIPRKSLDTAIKALAKTGIENSELRIVGAGPERPHLENLARSLGLRDRVHFTGEVPPEQIPAQLEAADVFVFTSASEGRPNAVLEAMASGLPVAASRIEGVAELITDGANGLLFEMGDADALADCLARLASDRELRRKLGSAARQFLIDQDLTWERTAAKYLRVYEACSGRQG